MSTLFMLDTNAVSALVKGRAAKLTALLRTSPFCISVLTEAELRYGLARRPINANLRKIVEALLAAVDIRPRTTKSAGRYGPLRAELDAVGKPLAPMDLLIAAHALAEDCTLVTADRAFTQSALLHPNRGDDRPAQRTAEARAGDLRGSSYRFCEGALVFK